jgi:hypothetical protein
VQILTRLRATISAAVFCGIVFAPAVASAQAQVQPGQVIISEFRLRGPSGAEDEFIELYNNTDSDIVVQSSDGSPGWAVAFSNGQVLGNAFVVPNGTVIPARGHFLGANDNGYSLADYPAGNPPPPTTIQPTRQTATAGKALIAGPAFGATTPDAIWTFDITDDSGIALFSTTRIPAQSMATRLDAVGFIESPALFREGGGFPTQLLGNRQSTLFRDMRTPGGLPQDTNENAHDFVLANVGDLNGDVSFDEFLGAPGPENLGSPVLNNNRIGATLLDPSVSSTQAPNRERRPNVVPNGNLGTLVIRRTITNNTGLPVTRLRFRVISITAPNADGDCGRTLCADVRAVTSSDGESGSPTIGVVPVRGLRLEEPPAQPLGGGFNASLSADFVTLSTPLAPGQSVNIQFVLGVMRSGTFRFYVNVEALTNQPILNDEVTGPQ